jgi:hypothetical protein
MPIFPASCLVAFAVLLSVSCGWSFGRGQAGGWMALRLLVRRFRIAGEKANKNHQSWLTHKWKYRLTRINQWRSWHYFSFRRPLLFDNPEWGEFLLFVVVILYGCLCVHCFRIQIWDQQHRPCCRLQYKLAWLGIVLSGYQQAAGSSAFPRCGPFQPVDSTVWKNEVWRRAVGLSAILYVLYSRERSESSLLIIVSTNRSFRREGRL